MAITIQVIRGSYKGQSVDNQIFTLATPAGGDGRIQVKNNGQVDTKFKKLTIDLASNDSYKILTNERSTRAPKNAMAFTVVPESVEETPPTPEETDEQAMDRIRERFDILRDMTKAAVSGDIRAMIVSGPPGVGKSYGIEQEIDKATLFDQLAGKRLRAEVVKGSATPIGLYQTLYKYSDANCVVVFDDCDSILLDDVSLNLLKGALDTGKTRKISWLSESSALRREGIPDQFNFKGSVIFITNLKFDQMKSQKLRDHLDALQSRCHYLDLTLNTQRDKILRIKQIAKDGELFQEYGFEEHVQAEIIDFMSDNQNRLREMSLRMALKIADLRKMSEGNWKRLAETTCMKAA